LPSEASITEGCSQIVHGLEKNYERGYKSGLVSIKSMLDAWPDYIGIQIEVPCLQLNFILQLIQCVGLNKHRDFVPKNRSKAATETNSKVIC
jgi:hypothetical protein